MARINELSKLFQALSSRDWIRACSVAEYIADTEEEAGHHSAAATLRGALASTGPRAENTPSVTLLMSDAIPDVLTPLADLRHLSTIELTSSTRSTIEELIKEQRHRALLAEHGLEPRRRLFFHGPPGCGKTITACALATELGLPLFVVRFDALVGAYLGQTAVRVREVFRFAEQHPSVVLIDEVDAVGRRRGKPTDVGELDRVVISLMQQLDLVRPLGLLVAASNIPDDLDPALLRRFDAAIEFPAPDQVALQDFGQQQVNKRGMKMHNGVQQQLEMARTYADVERIVIVEQRRILLRGL